jgi:uncharacterized membrane protein YdjX (TVP38/TMEM64 family)
MGKIKQFIKKIFRKKVAAILIAVLLLAVLIAAIVIWHEPIFSFFTNKEAIKDFIRSAGVFGPALFILLQIAQVVIAPIPGQLTGFVGGYLFGFSGLFLTVIGSTIGFLIVFILARRFGRPLIEKLFKKKTIAKFDYVTKSKGSFLLFLIFLLPTFPDDLIAYLAGMTKIPIKKLVLVSVVGRFPGYLILNLTGDGLANENIRPIIAIVITTVVILAIAYWQRRWLARFVKAKNHLDFARRNWPLSRFKSIALAIVISGLIVTSILLAIL